MIKTQLFVSCEQVNEWIEENTLNNPRFKVKDIQYRPYDKTLNTIFVVYEEQTEKEKDNLVKTFSNLFKEKDDKYICNIFSNSCTHCTPGACSHRKEKEKENEKNEDY